MKIGGIKYNYIEFDESQSFFRMKKENEEAEILIEYIPKIDTSFESKEFDVYFFSNSYLNAENDVFQVYDKDLEKRIGWIFPIQVLISNDNDYADDIHLNKYKFAVYKHLLKKANSNRPSNENQLTLKLTDLYHEDIIIFVHSKETTNNKSINIINYFPSFANYGYYYWDDNSPQYFDLQRSLVIDKRGSEKILIESTKSNITENNFIAALYKTYLKSSNHFLLKFHMLYQVVELLIEHNFDHEFKLLTAEYKAKNLSRNDLRERFNDILRERVGINSFFSKQAISENLRNNFNRDCKLLLNSFNSKDKNDIGNLLYDVRNLVVHRYRDIIGNIENERILELITHQLEQIVNEAIIKYKDYDRPLPPPIL